MNPLDVIATVCFSLMLIVLAGWGVGRFVGFILARIMRKHIRRR